MSPSPSIVRPWFARLSVWIGLALALWAGSAARDARADTIKVGANGITTIQQAVDAAILNTDANDTVVIPGGTYDEMVSITLTATAQKRLTLQRGGNATVTVRGTTGNPAIRVLDSSNVTLKNLVLKSGSSGDSVAALEVAGASLNIHGENLKGTFGDDVGVAVLGTNVSGVTLDACDFGGMVGFGYLLEGKNGTLDGCKADGCLLNSIVLAATSSNWAIRNSTFDGAGFTNPSLPGVVAIRGVGHRLEKITVTNGGSGGFWVDGALVSGVLLERCTARNNLIGVLGGGAGVVISKGTYKKNTSHGLYLDHGGTTVKRATISGNGGNGIIVLAGANVTTIVGNRFKKNVAQGVFAQGAFAWLEDNTGSGDGFDADELTGNANSGRDNTTDAGQVNDFK